MSAKTSFKVEYLDRYSEASRATLLIEFGSNDVRGRAEIVSLLVQLLSEAEEKGFHGAEVEILMFKKEN